MLSHGYVQVFLLGHPHANRRGYVYEHVAVASHALGRALPEGTEVHHVNEIKSDNRGANLVVCQDRAYHKLLHQRMRRRRNGGSR
jgi:hypothetical protein